jgi:hypothetical protein
MNKKPRWALDIHANDYNDCMSNDVFFSRSSGGRLWKPLAYGLWFLMYHTYVIGWGSIDINNTPIE